MQVYIFTWGDEIYVVPAHNTTDAVSDFDKWLASNPKDGRTLHSCKMITATKLTNNIFQVIAK